MWCLQCLMMIHMTCIFFLIKYHCWLVQYKYTCQHNILRWCCCSCSCAHVYIYHDCVSQLLIHVGNSTTLLYMNNLSYFCLWEPLNGRGVLISGVKSIQIFWTVKCPVYQGTFISGIWIRGVLLYNHSYVYCHAPNAGCFLYAANDCDDITCAGNTVCFTTIASSSESESSEERCHCSPGFNSSASCEGIVLSQHYILCYCTQNIVFQSVLFASFQGSYGTAGHR